MLKKTYSNSMPDATKSSDKKLDDGNQQPKKAQHQKEITIRK